MPSPLRVSVNGSGQASYPPGTSYGPRTLRDYEWVWILDGCVRWEVDGQVIAAGPGSLLLARPGMRDRFVWDPRRLTRHGWLHCSFSAPAALGPPAAWPLHRHVADDDILLPLLHHAAWLDQQQPAGWRGLLAGALHHAFAVFVAGAAGGARPVPQPRHPVVARVLDGLAEAWAEGDLAQPSLGRLAGLGGVSVMHLTRIFRRETGLPPATAVRLLRLDRAAALLADGAARVQEVAERCGFASPFHFSRAFRAAYGLSPQGYRRRVASGHPPPRTPLVRLQALGGGGAGLTG